jgi:hypothetical protein
MSARFSRLEAWREDLGLRQAGWEIESRRVDDKAFSEIQIATGVEDRIVTTPVGASALVQPEMERGRYERPRLRQTDCLGLTRLKTRRTREGTKE